MIDTDGYVVKTVHERDEASHAGADAQWQGIRPLNASSIGIEMVNKKGPMTDEQMKSLIELLKALMKKYDIKKKNVVGHCEVSPLKKGSHGAVSNERQDCPGQEFDWQKLEKAGVAATLYTPHTGGTDVLLSRYPYFVSQTKPLRLNDNDKGAVYGGEKRTDGKYLGTIRAIQVDLQSLGYESPVDEATAQASKVALPVWGKYDAAMGRVVDRFKARYLIKRDDEPTKPPLDQTLDKVTARAIRRAQLGRAL